MNLPPGGAQIVTDLYTRYKQFAEGSDDERRLLTLWIAQTFCARFGVSWGTKATTEKHPPSKDAIAYRNTDGTIDVFDWQNGATRAPQLREGQAPTFANARTMAGGPPQHFIAVAAIDHLAGLPAPAEPPPPAAPPTAPPPGATTQLQALIDRLQEIVGGLSDVRRQCDGLNQRLDKLIAEGLRIRL